MASVGATLVLSYFILNHEVQSTIFRVTGGSTGESTVAEFARQSAYVIRNNPNIVGLTVAMGWLILSLGHRWRPEPSWIDRAGRIVGAYWLLMIVVPLIASALLECAHRADCSDSLETPFRVQLSPTMRSPMASAPAEQPPLDPTALARFGRLELLARLVVEGVMSGLHKSPFKGFSVEFAEHRQYGPGDEIRHIDWRHVRQDGSLLRQGI